MSLEYEPASAPLHISGDAPGAARLAAPAEAGESGRTASQDLLLKSTFKEAVDFKKLGLPMGVPHARLLLLLLARSEPWRPNSRLDKSVSLNPLVHKGHS